jgi:hypothetical protein
VITETMERDQAGSDLSCHVISPIIERSFCAPALSPITDFRFVLNSKDYQYGPPSYHDLTVASKTLPGVDAKVNLVFVTCPQLRNSPLFWYLNEVKQVED